MWPCWAVRWPTAGPTEGYAQAEHPVQQAAWKTVAAWCDVPAEELGLGVDGCGVTVFALPLSQMALAYARLGAAAQFAATR
jgi:L-asparaginase II